MEYYKKRIKKLRELYPDKSFLFYDNISRLYLTGFSSSEEGDGVLLITPDKGYLFIDGRYIEDAKKNIKSVKVELINSYSEAFQNIRDILEKEKINEVLIDGNRILLNSYKNIKKILKGIKIKVEKDILAPLRIIKDEQEIAIISKAVEISEKAFNETIKLIKPGVSEKDIAVELEYNMCKFGGMGPGFETIVLFGAKSSLPHGVPSHEVKCREKEIILIDFGVKYKYYTSDLTRTFFLGNPTEKMEKIYLTVLRANQKVIDKLKTDMLYKNVDKIARKEIEKAGYGKFFTHSLGHGIGLEIHENPFLSPRMKRGRLRAGMVFTDEPGIYLENEFGVRIEDDIYLTNDGPIHLSSGLSREILVL